MPKRLGALVLLLAAVSGTTLLGSLQVAPDLNPDTDLTVHEWGTFTSVAGPDGRALEWAPLAGPSDLPCFVLMLDPNSPKAPTNRSLPALKATVRMETPVLYFYASHAATVQVNVRFPHGLITEWYPQARVPAVVPGLALADATGAIEWNAVKILPGAQASFPTEPGSSHYYAARATDASPLQIGSQQERFLFYRGLASFPAPVSARIDDHGTIVIAQTGTIDIRHAILFESDGTRVGYRVVNHLQDAATIARPALTSNVASLRQDLQDLLTEQGLYPREAKAMVDTWQDSWFEPGTRLFYLVPSAATDAILPLRIQPTPAHLARAFVGRLEIITPQVEADVERAIRANDLPTLLKHGRFLEPIVQGLSPRFSSSRDQAIVGAALRAVAARHASSEAPCK